MDKEVELEEFEPLFDYSRIQPANLAVFDDDSMDFLWLDGKKNKRTKCGKVENREDDCIILDVDDEDNNQHKKKIEDEEDWLPLPPPMPVKSKTLPWRDSKIDETLNELRLKKKELAAFVHSSDTIMNEAIKAAKQEVFNSKSAAAKSEPEQVKVKTQQVERPKIVISIQNKDGIKQFRVNKDEKLDKLFKTYAERVNFKFENLAFCFDGEKICPGATPASLDMDDEDIIEMMVKSH